MTRTNREMVQIFFSQICALVCLPPPVDVDDGSAAFLKPECIPVGWCIKSPGLLQNQQTPFGIGLPTPGFSWIQDKGKEKFSKIPKKNAPSTKDSRSLPTFRSSFVSLYLLVGSLRKHITDDHMKIMEKTPFAGIFRVFIEDKVDKSNVTKASSDIVTVLDRYDVDRDAFTFGKTSVPFTVQDVAVVFGLPAIGKTVILQPRGYIVKSEFMERNFKGDEKLSKLNLEKALKKTVLNACETDMEDFAKLMVVYIVMNVFAPWIAFSFFQYVEDFYEMNEIAWAEVFFTNLKKQVVKWKTANSITYCPMMLLYFLLEHVDLIAPIKGNEDVSPRFGKWCLTTLKDTLSAEKLEKISAEKVHESLKTLTDKETLLWSIEGHNLRKANTENVDIKEFKRVQDQNRTLIDENRTLKNDNIQLSKKVKELEEVIKVLYGAESSANKEEMNIIQGAQNLHTRASACTMQTPPSPSAMQTDMAEVTENADSRCQENEEVEKEVEVEEINKRKRKQKSVGEESNKDPQNSKIQRIKTRERRKKINDPSFEYTVVDVEKHVSKVLDSKLKNVTRSPCWRYLDEQKKKVVSQFFKAENRNYLIGQGLVYEVDIYGKDVEDLMFNNLLSGQIIDWWTRSFEKKKGDEIHSCFFFSSLVSGILREGSDEVLKTMLLDTIDGMDRSMDWWFLPVIADQHWALVHVDTLSWEWFFYNSKNPRKGQVDACKEEALVMQAKIIEIVQTRKPDFVAKGIKIDKKMKTKICPQQRNPDCALYVCKFMKTISTGYMVEDLNEEDMVYKMQKKRAKMAFNILNNSKREN